MPQIWNWFLAGMLLLFSVLSLLGWSSKAKELSRLESRLELAHQERIAVLVQQNKELAEYAQSLQEHHKAAMQAEVSLAARKGAAEALVALQGRSMQENRLEPEDATNPERVAREFCLQLSAVRGANQTLAGAQGVPYELPEFCKGGP